MVDQCDAITSFIHILNMNANDLLKCSCYTPISFIPMEFTRMNSCHFLFKRKNEIVDAKSDTPTEFESLNALAFLFIAIPIIGSIYK